MVSARLITTLQCNRNCEGCCNKDWKGTPPVGALESDLYYSYNEILITGGEPMLFPKRLTSLLTRLCYDNPGLRRILYTAVPDYKELIKLAWLLDGVTITLHNNSDVERYNKFHSHLYVPNIRVNVFHKDISTPVAFEKKHYYKQVEWIKDCPLPGHETLYQLLPLWS